MALLSFRGIDTPSLQAQGEQRLPPIFNIQRDNAPISRVTGVQKTKHTKPAKKKGKLPETV